MKLKPFKTRLLRNYSTGKKFVFLEGPAGVGKTSICNLLSKNGFNVRFEKFVELCDANPIYSPIGSIMSIKWVSTLLSSLENYNKEQNTETTIKYPNIVFIDRSLLSPYIYARGSLNNYYVLDAMKEVKQVFNCTVVLCKTDYSIMRDRLKSRYDRGDEQEKEIRKSLGELNENYLHYIVNRYKRLEREGWFELSIDSGKDINKVTLEMLEQIGVETNTLDWTPHSIPNNQEIKI